MAIVFYLPESVSMEKAYEIWAKQERVRHLDGARLTYLKSPKERIQKPTRLRDILKKCERSTTVIVWDVAQLGFIEEFHHLLAVRRL